MNKNILKGYQDELKKIDKAYAQIKEIPTLFENRANNRSRFISATPEERDAIISEIKRETAERDAIEQENEKIKVKIACLRHNAYIVFCKEVYPLLIDVLTPYFGKSYGEKTKEKTRNEFKTRYGISFYFKTDCEIVFQPLDNNGYSYGRSYSIHAKHDAPFLTSDNKLNDLNDVEMTTGKRPYIENVNRRVNDLYKAYDDAKKAYDNFKNKSCAYAVLTVEDLKDINYYNPNFSGII